MVNYCSCTCYSLLFWISLFIKYFNLPFSFSVYLSMFFCLQVFKSLKIHIRFRFFFVAPLYSPLLSISSPQWRSVGVDEGIYPPPSNQNNFAYCELLKVVNFKYETPPKKFLQLRDSKCPDPSLFL